MRMWKRFFVSLLLVVPTVSGDQLVRLIISKSGEGVEQDRLRLTQVYEICSSVSTEYGLKIAPNRGDDPGVKKYAQPRSFGVGFTGPTIFCAPSQGPGLAIITVSNPQRPDSRKIVVALERALKARLGAHSVRDTTDSWNQF